jgi:hypothetical protein
MASKSTFTFVGVDKVTPELKQISSQLNTFQKSFQNLAKSMVGITAVTAGFVALKNVIFDSVTSFAEYEKSILRLQAQLKVSGSNLGLSFTQLKNLANDLEGRTGIDDQQILDSISLLQSFQNVRGDVFKSAVTESVNLAQVFGSLETAAKQIGSALDDPINGLDKLAKASISFTDAEQALYKQLVEAGKLSEAQLLILEKVKTKSAEIADIMASGMSGSMDRFANNWDDLMKSLGNSWTTYLKGPLDWMTSALEGVTQAVNQNRIMDAYNSILKDTSRYLNLQDYVSRANSSLGIPSTNLNKSSSVASSLTGVTKVESWLGGSVEDALATFQARMKLVENSLKTADRTQVASYQKELDSLYQQIKQFQTLVDLKAESNRITRQTAIDEANSNAKAQIEAEKLAKKLEEQRLEAERIRNMANEMAQGNSPTTAEMAMFFQYLNQQSFTPVTEEVILLDDAVKLTTADWAEYYNQLTKINALQHNPTSSKQTFTEKLIQDWKTMASSLGSKSDTSPFSALSDDLALAFDKMSPLTDSVLSIYNTIASLDNEAHQLKLSHIQDEYSAWEKAQQNKLDLSKADGSYTAQLEIDYINAKAEQQAKVDEAQRAEKKRQWEANKASQLGSIAMSTAQGVMSALGQVPFGPWNFLQAGLVGTVGATQAGIVASQQIPNFATGGVISGAYESGDKLLIRANAKERVLTAKQNAQLEAIANGSGGVVVNIGTVAGSVDAEFAIKLAKELKRQQFLGRVQ